MPKVTLLVDGRAGFEPRVSGSVAQILSLPFKLICSPFLKSESIIDLQTLPSVITVASVCVSVCLLGAHKSVSLLQKVNMCLWRWRLESELPFNSVVSSFPENLTRCEK